MNTLKENLIELSNYTMQQLQKRNFDFIPHDSDVHLQQLHLDFFCTNDIRFPDNWQNFINSFIKELPQKLVFFNLEIPKGLKFASIYVTDNISFRLIAAYQLQSDNFVLRIDVLFGTCK